MNSPLPYIGGKSRLAETREIFGAFKITPVTVTYTANAVKMKQGKELLISNC